MDNLSNSDFGDQNLNVPNPLDKGADNLAPFEDGGINEMSVSHSPLDLGDTGMTEAQKLEVPKPVAKPTDLPLTDRKPVEEKVTMERIIGVKTFFTKLHPGALNFLDEQITKWLKENPDIKIKRTNIVTGEIQAKKTEPNIIMTVWY